MVGADEAHYQAIAGRSSRVITFPDGKPRLITLKKRYWDVLDMMHTKKGFPKNHIPLLAWQGVTHFDCPSAPNFDDKLRWMFSHLLRLNMSYVMKKNGVWETANEDNLGVPMPSISLVTIFASAALLND